MKFFVAFLEREACFDVVKTDAHICVFDLIQHHDEEVLTMNWDQIKGKWTEFQGATKEKWGELTDDDWKEIDGQREKLAGKLQARYGKTKEEAEREIDEMAAKFN